jgi:hypothetical protein
MEKDLKEALGGLLTCNARVTEKKERAGLICNASTRDKLFLLMRESWHARSDPISHGSHASSATSRLTVPLART